MNNHTKILKIIYKTIQKNGTKTTNKKNEKTINMKKDWIECTFEDLLDYEQPTKYIVKSTKYSDDYKTPVLTAGKSFIKGYTNETEGIFEELPTIIFDDFTTASQFVDFKFKVKSSAMKILVPTSNLVNMKFVFNCMQVNIVRNDTHKRYWISVYAKKKILLPPLAEQRAIVRKIETLFSDLDSGTASLKKAQEQLKIYRQAVLKRAFEGGFTKNTAVSTSSTTDAKVPELVEGTNEKNHNSDNLPEGWIEGELGNIISISSGKGLTKDNREDDGLYFVYGGNGITGKHSEFLFENEKLIIGRVGVYCGNVNITKPKSWITDNAFVVGFDENVFDLYFLHYFLTNLNLNKYASSTAQPVISQGKIYPIEILYPNSKAEQHAIVHEIERRLSVTDELEKIISAEIERSRNLRQSILKKAFEGKLLSDAEIEQCKKEADYEPVAKLLERIKQEKHNNSKKIKMTNKKR